MTESDDIEEAKPPDLNEFLLPITEITPERTEIVTHREKTFITKLPAVVKVNELKLKRFNTYCGSNFLERNLSHKAERFQSLTRSLSDIPAHFENMSLEKPGKCHDTAEQGDEEEDGEREETGNTKNDGRVTQVESELDDDRKRHGHETPRVVCDKAPRDGHGNVVEIKMKIPEPSLYQKLKIDRECMFPMLNRLTKSSSEELLMTAQKKESEKARNALRKWSEHIIHDIKTKNSIVDFTKRYGQL
jgi:hypothetical protein